MTGREPSAAHWSDRQLRLFRRMHAYMKANQAHFTRDSAPRIDKLDWAVISRMAALYAAHNMEGDATGETRPAFLDTDPDPKNTD